MDDSAFVEAIKAKIERLTGRSISLIIEEDDPNALEIGLDLPVPEVVLGSDAIRYPGFARMCIEYAVASISLDREIGSLEFHLLLARN